MLAEANRLITLVLRISEGGVPSLVDVAELSLLLELRLAEDQSTAVRTVLHLRQIDPARFGDRYRTARRVVELMLRHRYSDGPAEASGRHRGRKEGALQGNPSDFPPGVR